MAAAHDESLGQTLLRHLLGEPDQRKCKEEQLYGSGFCRLSWMKFTICNGTKWMSYAVATSPLGSILNTPLPRGTMDSLDFRDVPLFYSWPWP